MQYEYSKETGYVFLGNIELTGLPDKVTVENHELLRKGEFHVSIMATKRLAPMLEGINPDEASEQLANTFLDFVKSHDMKAMFLSNELRLVKRDERVTLVAMVNVPFLEDLFAHLRSSFGVDFPTQPAHITIYTLQPEKGIGLLSHEELEAESSVVEVPELAGMRIVSND